LSSKRKLTNEDVHTQHPRSTKYIGAACQNSALPRSQYKFHSPRPNKAFIVVSFAYRDFIQVRGRHRPDLAAIPELGNSKYGLSGIYMPLFNATHSLLNWQYSGDFIGEPEARKSGESVTSGYETKRDAVRAIQSGAGNPTSRCQATGRCWVVQRQIHRVQITRDQRCEGCGGNWARSKRTI
jgi:hypothetical protein